MTRQLAAAALVMLLTNVRVVEGQAVPRNPNFVDTITVGRLPTGGCEWSKAAQRMRPGQPGTTTRAGQPNDATCTVVAYNYTSGSGQEPPAVVAFAFVQDHKDPLPKNGVLNFADTFTVARRPDGNCDWGAAPVRPGKRGSSSYLGEVRTRDCWGVVYNVTMPVQDMTRMKSDTTTMIVADNGVMPSPGAFQAVRDVVLKTFSKPDTIEITNTRLKGDSAWVSVRHTATTWTIYTIVNRDGVWRIVEQADGGRSTGARRPRAKS